MRKVRKTRPAAKLVGFLIFLALVYLSACKNISGNPDSPKSLESTANVLSEQPRSALIEDLRSRRSILPPDGILAEVAHAVLRASSGAAEAEVRLARIRSDAKSKNWLPSIGPTVGLTSLGGVVAQLVLDQTIFDNGRRAAERDLALADVDVAAVQLVQELNLRVYEGLHAYITAERANAQAVVAERAARRLSEFERIVEIRVQGGLADRSEQQIISQKRAEMEAKLGADRQAAAQSISDLLALTKEPVKTQGDLSTLLPNTEAPEALSVVMSRAEGRRTLAEARMAKSGLMPGLNARVALDETGELTPQLALGGALFGAGSAAQFRAIEAVNAVVTLRTQKAQEEAKRRLISLNSELAALQLQQARGIDLLSQASNNLDLFFERYEMGTAALIELVIQFELTAQMERENVAIKYDLALIDLRIARERGQLLNGADL